ncbi:MAG: hypothetical protein OXU75_14450 [Deltaproteobacteria bacterium]|nr:hypothetical protein [Deltaproteobacteria bacterium]
MANEGPKTAYLVGSVWPTNRTGVLGDKELDPKLPPSIRLVHLSMGFTQGNLAEFQASIPGYEAKVAELAAMKPDLIRVIGAPPFMLLGYEGERDTIRSWEERYGIPMVTSGQNHVRAFRTLGVRRIVGASYFPEDLNALFRTYLTDAGFEMLGMDGIDVPFADVPKVPSSEIRRQLTDMFARHPGGECLYMLGSAWKTLDIIEPLEADLGVPVVHALPARCWETQMRLGVQHPIPGYGRLLAEMPEPA